MCAKKRTSKRRSVKKQKKSHSYLIIFIVIIAIAAAAIAYFVYGVGKTKHAFPTKPHTTITKTVHKKKTIRAKSALEGTWVSTSDGRMLEIYGNLFTLELPSVSEHKITKGKISISGNTASILFTGTNDKCSRDAGTYSFVVGKGSIRFSVKHDNCPGRKQIFSTTWERF